MAKRLSPITKTFKALEKSVSHFVVYKAVERLKEAT